MTSDLGGSDNGDSLFPGLFCFGWLWLLGGACFCDGYDTLSRRSWLAFGGCDGEDTIRRQGTDEVSHLVAGGQDVSAGELARDEAVLVLLLFVLAFHQNGVVGGLHCDLFGGELLYI